MITFLTRAFGFTERMEHLDRGIVQHAELIWTGPNGQVGRVMISRRDVLQRSGSTRHRSRSRVVNPASRSTQGWEAVSRAAATSGGSERGGWLVPYADEDMGADGLVDKLHLFVYPLTRGSGPRLFPEGAVPANLSLAACESYDNGVLYLAYRPQA